MEVFVGCFPLKLYKIVRRQEYSLFACHSLCSYFPQPVLCPLPQMTFFPTGLLGMHPFSWLDHESPRVGNNFPRSLSSLSGAWAQSRFLRNHSSGSHDIQRALQTLASFDQRRPHREGVPIYIFLMRTLRHREAKCPTQERPSLDLNSNRLTL